MGTRNLTIVKSKKRIKIAQYGQSDGYPRGQGATIANFIHNIMKLEEFKQLVDQLEFAEDYVDDNELVYYSDTAAGILQLVHEGGVKYLKNSMNFFKDSLFCEWAYEIDLDEETVTTYKSSKELDKVSFKEFTKEYVGILDRLFYSIRKMLTTEDHSNKRWCPAMLLANSAERIDDY